MARNRLEKKEISVIKSKRYTGVYYNELSKGDKAFYFTYRKPDERKMLWVKVGKYSEGMRENIAFTLRSEQLSKIKHGEDITVVAKKKKKEVITYDKIAQIYFKDKETRKERISRYERYIKPVFGDIDIQDINKVKIRAFLKNIVSMGRTPQTVNGIRELFSAIINHNIRERELKYINPCLGIPRYKVDNGRERYLTLDEIKIFKEQLDKRYDAFLVNLFVDLSLQTGGRLETILHIQKKDVNLDNGTITLRNLKTKNIYTGFLQDDLVKRLKPYLLELRMNDYVVSFENEHERKLTSKNIQSRIKPILDKLFNEGLDTKDTRNRVVLHTFRHTFASHLAINGVPIFTIQKLMDHKKIEQTMRYAKLSPENGKNAVVGLYK